MKFGGTLAIGKRKSKRPLDTRCPMHLVLKARQDFLFEHVELIRTVVHKFAKKFDVPIYGMAIHFDHIHFNVSPNSRDQYNNWIRAVTGQISAKIPGLEWKLVPFTRVAKWGKDFEDLQNYLIKNIKSAKFIVAAHKEVKDFERRLFASLPR